LLTLENQGISSAEARVAGRAKASATPSYRRGFEFEDTPTPEKTASALEFLATAGKVAADGAFALNPPLTDASFVIAPDGDIGFPEPPKVSA
jgi:hypothetical protein